MALEKMNDKLKNRILRLTNRLIVSLMIAVGMACCGSLAVYGAEEGLTEEEVKQQVVEIIEEEKQEEITDYTIVEYDIDKIYPIISLDFFVNDYIDGMTFEEIIRKQENTYVELNEGDSQYILYWYLPYKNCTNQNCIITFLVDNENVEIFTRKVGVENDYDIKLYEGKYEEISLEKTKEIVYLNFELYGFRAVYLRTYEEKEYIIPYLYGEVKEWCELECENVYNLDEFITVLYNCYKEIEVDGNRKGKTNVNFFCFN